ncbi:MAG: hypothetical protein ISS31_03245 [Kiritimatiellae bacterium]|nr:hypothetical protein [Kiritimatiellia bacterium]
MKRILGILAVVALVAMTVQAVEVKSENVAGVYTKTLPSNGGLLLVAVQVDPFDSADANLAGVLGTDQLRGFISKVQSPDKVYVWNGTGYDIYWLEGGEWVDESGPTNPPIETGDAFWIRSAQNEDDPLDLTITGQAVESTDITTPISAGLNLAGYPFSSKIAVNDTDFINDGASQFESKKTSSDKIYLWDNVNGGYTILISNLGNDYWHLEGSDGSTPATEEITLGDAFWYKAEGGYSWDETNKYLNNL